MPISTIRPVLAEPSSIPQTLLNLAIRVDMQVHALRIRTLPVFTKKPTLRHLLQIIFMQKLAILSLLAQPPKPMLADDGFVGSTVFEGAGGAFGAGAFEEEATDVEGGGVGGVEGFEI